MSSKPAIVAHKPPCLTFTALVTSIRAVNDDLAAHVGRAVNMGLTLRNWLIGWHIETYDRSGVDRAKYGDRLMERLAGELTRLGVSRCDRRELYRYRAFYLAYPRIVESLPPQFKQLALSVCSNADAPRGRPASGIVRSATPQLIAHPTLLTQLSFTHIAELLNVTRVLKCHVLVDLKLEAFCHENVGQLNTYVTWYRRHMMQKEDNPPVGMLLCAQKDNALAEYALAGMDNHLFVSKYQLHLPKPAQLRRRLKRAMQESAP